MLDSARTSGRARRIVGIKGHQGVVQALQALVARVDDFTAGGLADPGIADTGGALHLRPAPAMTFQQCPGAAQQVAGQV